MFRKLVLLSFAGILLFPSAAIGANAFVRTPMTSAIIPDSVTRLSSNSSIY